VKFRVTRHWLELANQWLEVTRQFLWLDSDSTQPRYDSDSTRKSFRWFWLEGFVTLTRQKWFGHITARNYKNNLFCWNFQNPRETRPLLAPPYNAHAHGRLEPNLEDTQWVFHPAVALQNKFSWNIRQWEYANQGFHSAISKKPRLFMKKKHCLPKKTEMQEDTWMQMHDAKRWLKYWFTYSSFFYFVSAALKLTFGSLFCYSKHLILTSKADNRLHCWLLSLFRLR